MLIKNNCYLDYHKRDGSFAIIGNMSAEFSAHISGLQKYHKFPDGLDGLSGVFCNFASRTNKNIMK